MINIAIISDEIDGLLYANRPFLSIFQREEIKINPPLHLIPLFFLLKMTHNIMFLRFTFSIFGVLTIYITYLIGKRFGVEIAVISSLFVAISLKMAYSSILLRQYSFFVLFSSLSIYYFHDLYYEGKNHIKYIVSVVIALYTHYLTFLILLFQVIFLLKKLNKKVIFQTLTILVFIQIPAFVLVLMGMININQELPVLHPGPKTNFDPVDAFLYVFFGLLLLINLLKKNKLIVI